MFSTMMQMKKTLAFVVALSVSAPQLAQAKGFGGMMGGGGPRFQSSPKSFASKPIVKTGAMFNGNAAQLRTLNANQLNVAKQSSILSKFDASKLATTTQSPLVNSNLLKPVNQAKLGGLLNQPNSNSSPTGPLANANLNSKLKTQGLFDFPTPTIPNIDPSKLGGAITQGPGGIDPKSKVSKVGSQIGSKLGGVATTGPGGIDPKSKVGKVGGIGGTGGSGTGGTGGTGGGTGGTGGTGTGGAGGGGTGGGTGGGSASTPSTPSAPSTPSTPSQPTTPSGPMGGGSGSGFPLPFPLGGGVLGSVLSGGFGGGAGGGYSDGGSSDGGYVDSTPAVQAPVAQAAVAQPVVAEAVGNVDLVVEDIALAAPATMIAGPAYTVLFRNQGLQACGAFRVGVFAMMDGKLAEDARALVDVPGLAAGGQQVVTLRLPAASMRLVNASTGQASAFNQLLVAVDPDGIVPESNKDNNVATLDRAALEAR